MKTGSIVWHDLFTRNMRQARSFYGRVAGWHFVSEQAPDFAWGGGAHDFVLALRGDEAGAGFIDRAAGRGTGWIPYIEVRNVDAAAALALDLGGTVERPSFDVAGVGRNCLLRDPLGAVVGISFSRHGFPPPTRQFGIECYVANETAFPADFYRRLFDWNIAIASNLAPVVTICRRSDVIAALHIDVEERTGPGAMWMPCIRVEQLSEALKRAHSSKGTVVTAPRDISDLGTYALVHDPDGSPAILCHVAAHPPGNR